jgi:hypothetical protein
MIEPTLANRRPMTPMSRRMLMCSLLLGWRPGVWRFVRVVTDITSLPVSTRFALRQNGHVASVPFRTLDG